MKLARKGEVVKLLEEKIKFHLELNHIQRFL